VTVTVYWGRQGQQAIKMMISDAIVRDVQFDYL